MTIALPDNATGADLVDAIARYARVAGISETKLLSQLTSDPRKWKHQTAIAQRPKPATIERVRKLLAGEPVPPPPSNNFQARRAEGPGTSERLRAAVFAESRAIEQRRLVAASTATVAQPLSRVGDQPVLTFAPPADRDFRTQAADREPCTWCGTRGDIGCRHRRPA